MHTLKKRELPSNILRYVLLLLGGAVIGHADDLYDQHVPEAKRCAL